MRSTRIDEWLVGFNRTIENVTCTIISQIESWGCKGFGDKVCGCKQQKNGIMQTLKLLTDSFFAAGREKKPFMKSFSFYFLRCRFSRSLLIGLRPKMSSSSWSRADDPIPSVDNKIAEIRTRWKLRFCRLNRFRIVGLLARSSNGAALVEKCSLMMVIIQSRGSMERNKIASQCPNRNHERAGSAI